jgi:hypothetical protein
MYLLRTQYECSRRVPGCLRAGERQSPEYGLQVEAVVEAILERHEIASDIVPAHQFQDTGYDRLEIVE